MSARRWELVATDESPALAKPLLDAIVVEDSQSDGGLANSAGTDKSDGREVFGETDNLLDQVVASETSPWCWRGRLSKCPRCKCKTVSP